MAMTTPDGWRIDATHADHTLLIARDGSGSLILTVPLATPPSLADMLRELITRFAPHVAFHESRDCDGAVHARARLDGEYLEAGVISNGDIAVGYLLAALSPREHARVVDAVVNAALTSTISPVAHWSD